MRTFVIGLLTVAGITIATPALAQFYIDTPIGEVGVGPGHDYDRHGYEGSRYRSYDGYQERSYARGCRTITVQRDDGSVRRIRRCD